MIIRAYAEGVQDLLELISNTASAKRPRGNTGAYKHMPEFVNMVTAFDIETTYLEDLRQSVMYIWQWAFTDQFCIYGRTWEEFSTFCTELSTVLGERSLVVYVHNLSFEFQFLADPTVYQFESEDVFCPQSRRILKCSMPKYHLEFRCSYMHSNMSLGKYLESMQVENPKLTMDYSKLRYPWTPLSPEELAYCLNDVIGLVQALEKEMQFDNDSIYTFPLTSTGYVRRDAKRAMKKHRRQVKKLIPDYSIYSMLREAFRGGDTHANRLCSGVIMEDVHSYDRSSSYPDVILNCKFPASEWYHVGAISEADYLDYIKRGYAIIARVALAGVELLDDTWPDPYIPTDKCRKLQFIYCDNGRILRADYLEITVTDIDMTIISKTYKWKSLIIQDCAVSRYGMLPLGLREINEEYYNLKTKLKGNDEQIYYYSKAKAKLNSIYGMTAQDPLRDDVTFTYDPLEPYHVEYGTEEKYEKDRPKQWLTYAWGVWVTSWARWRLYEGIKLVFDTPGAIFVYCDTDSVKYVGDVDWSIYNQQRQRDSKKNNAYAVDSKGKSHYMGVYESEDPYKRFITWGAKKYAYQYADDHIGVTVSGVNKRLGGKELEDHGGLDAFKPGFVFREAGGVELLYCDDVSYDIMREGHKLHIGRNVSIIDSEYTLGLTSEYSDLIHYEYIDGLELRL